MAGEFKITQTLVYENGKLQDKWQPAQFSLPQATQGYVTRVVEASTAEADVDLSTIATPGRLIMHSLEATSSGNPVIWGPKTSTGGRLNCGVLRPGETAMLYMNSTTTLRWSVQNNQNKVQVLLTVFEQ